MKFDVIIGNPPYQLRDGGHGASAIPLYDKFVQQAKKLNPCYLAMIIPSRWFAEGKGLGKFRQEMLNDDRIRKIVDFEDASEVFLSVDIAGGVCYFLWERDSTGLCEVVNICRGVENVSVRRLNEFDTFIRHDKAIPIIRKVLSKNEPTMDQQVSLSKPFGLRTFARPQASGDIFLRWRDGVGFYNRKNIAVGVEMIDRWKVIALRTADGDPGKDNKRRVFPRIEILPPKTVCTETYIVVGSYNAKYEAENMVAYMKTKLFRFLVSQFVYSCNITKKSYAFVPILDMSIRWTDEMLCERYDITPEEFAFIESKIRPMPNSEELGVG